MASSANYNHHPLPAPPPEQEDYEHYGHQQQPAQQYGYQPEYQPPQPHYQQHASYQDHQQPEYEPLPPPLQKPPPAQQPQRTRPKSRAFSFRSDKSQKSANGPSHHKNNLHETSAEKEAKRLHSKADPRMAMTEREPAMEAQTVSERPALRAIQHRDSSGNPIADPDRSNPTRSRWERPLDTIRSFEAAIDGGYNRKSVYRSDSDSVANWNRRSSYYGGNGPRPTQDGPYGYGGARPNRADSGMLDYRQSAMLGGSRDSLYDGGYEGGQNGYGGPGMGSRNRYSRMQAEPQLSGRERNVYPVPNNHRSYETVASGSGTGSMGEPMGYQTDPTSSENSSIDRRSPPKRQEPMNDYGISFGQSSNYQNSGIGIAPDYTAPQQSPAVPRKDPGGAILSKSSRATVNSSQDRPGMGEKRKSWFMRRFSKNS
ncbi:hypothetical protein GGR57DRAFT_414075 [Xylariaceae sp. FL1272]|nr:hypothetical protein GGR57DRAFT_414075 [Xylariaceae sp. FL1272]